MKKFPFIIFIFCLQSFFFFAQTSVYNPFVNTEIPQWPVIVNPGEYVANELLVMLKPGIDIGNVYDDFLQFGDTVTKINCCAKSMRVYELRFENNVKIENALKLAKTFPEIEIAQFNHYVAHRSTIPNDVQFGAMWDMDNTGQSGGTFDADIDAPEAWDITTGGMTVQGDTIVVAVIDAGFDLAHEDLNFKKNYAEIPNNNIDDDGNGYIDDFDGWNAYNSTGTIVSDFHGTHVAGIVGARGNNSVGVAGTSWGVKILPVMGSDGTEAQIVEAYTYVYDIRKLYNNTTGAQGEFIVATNSSFGVDQGQPANYPIWCAMYDSLGIVGILSAGATANQNWDVDVVGDMPTACSSNFLISVTNTDRNDLKFSSAAYGDTSIDIGAPGTQITSAMPGNTYGALSGTSMACPHVAGAIALMYAAACTQMITDYKNHPDSVALVVKNYLLTSADPNTSLNGITVSNRRLNLYNSLLAVQTYYCSTQEIGENNFVNLRNIFPNPTRENVTIQCQAAKQAEVKIIFTNVLGEEVFSVERNVSAGNNFLSCDVSSLSGGVYFVQVECGETVTAAQRLVIE